MQFLQVLMAAVNLGSMNAVLNANGVLNSFIGSKPNDAPGARGVFCSPFRLY